MKKIYILTAVMAAAALASCTREPVAIDGVYAYGPNAIAFTIQDEPGTRAGEVLSTTNIDLGKDANGQAMILQETVTRLGDFIYTPETKGTPATTENVAEIYGQFQADMFLYSNEGGRYDYTRIESGIQFVHDAKHKKWSHTFDENPLDRNPVIWSIFTMPGVNPRSINKTSYSLMSINGYQLSDNILDQKDFLITSSYLTKDEYNPTTGFSITFKHALVGVNFKLGNLESGNRIKSISLDGLYNKSTLRVSPRDGSFVWDPDGNQRDHTFSFDVESMLEDGTINNEDAEFTFWLIPMTLRPDASKTVNLTVTYQTPTDEVRTYTLDLDAALGGHVVWHPGELHTFTLNPGTFDYVLTLDQDELEFDGVTMSAAGSQKTLKVNSYRQHLTTSEKEALPWKVQALAEDGETWVDYGTEDWPAWLELSSASGEGSTTNRGETITVTVRPDHEDILVEEVGNNNTLATLVSTAEVGSESAPRDLSLYDIYGNAYVNGTNVVPSINKAGSHTANCYVVSAPGYYCFPLVYGNAIDQTRGTGGVNTQAFNKYVNVNDNIISSPYILNDLGIDMSNCDAVVLWEDQLIGKGVIRDAVEVINAPSGAGLSCPYIKFYLKPEYMIPGNIVIALRDKSAGDTPETAKILWSWHIWVTPITASLDIKDLKYRTALTEDAPLGSIQILNANLGWAAPMKFTVAITGSTQLRFVQDNSVLDPKDCPVTYDGGDVYKGTYSAGTYYQWGRKDPFLPSNGNTGTSCTNKAVHSPSNYPIVSSSSPTTGVAIKAMANDVGLYIANPNLFNSSGALEGCDDHWNAAIDASNPRPNYNIQYVIKTIYDPCPAGFCVPFVYAFTGFTSNGKVYSLQTGNVNGRKSTASTTTATPQGFMFSNTASHASESYSLFFAGAGLRSNIGATSYTTEVSSAGRLGVDWTNQAGYYWFSSRCYGSYSVYGAYSMFLASTAESDPNINPTDEGAIANGGRVVRPMVESLVETD